VIDTTDKASSRLVLERIRRVLLRGDPRDEHLGPVADTAGGLSGAGIERLLKNSRHVARHAGGPPPSSCSAEARWRATSRSTSAASAKRARVCAGRGPMTCKEAMSGALLPLRRMPETECRSTTIWMRPMRLNRPSRLSVVIARILRVLSSRFH
jgi:hypothetical protein